MPKRKVFLTCAGGYISANCFLFHLLLVKMPIASEVYTSGLCGSTSIR